MALNVERQATIGDWIDYIGYGMILTVSISTFSYQFIVKKRRESFIVGIPLLFTLECIFAIVAELIEDT